MPTLLLDVNVLVAAFDPDHVEHERVSRWAESSLADGWATCAITENGLVRVLSQPAYPGHVSVADARALLQANTADASHEFWPCALSITDPTIDSRHLLGHRQITDAYLLALAVRHGGALATLDDRISTLPVAGAGAQHLVIIGG